MKYTYLDYQNEMEFYCRGLIKNVLYELQKCDLHSEQSIYITFNIHCQGVVISKSLRDKYERSGEIVIVLQKNDYDNLVVNEIGFQAVLAFGDTTESIFVPFNSIVNFIDTMENFSLNLKPLHHTQIINIEIPENNIEHKKISNLIYFTNSECNFLNLNYESRMQFLCRAMIKNILENMQKSDCIQEIKISFEPKLIHGSEIFMHNHKNAEYTINLNQCSEISINPTGISLHSVIDGNYEILFVPFSSITSFVDVRANFALSLCAQDFIQEIITLPAKQQSAPVNNLINFGY